MLRLKRLEVEGFGPFAEPQTIKFPAGPGVTVVYGENMRGKTSLLNAIRYALFGTVLGRGSRARRLATITNRDLASGGKFGFSVVLVFDFAGKEYELVRTCRPVVLMPSRDEDYVQEVLLRRGNRPLGPQEVEKELHQILPFEVSRFFLFDGELLQEYEELLFNESEAGVKISAAIERILGVPILKQGRAHLTELMEDADKLAAKEASKRQHTKALGLALQQAAEQKEAHQREIVRLQAQLRELSHQKAELEEVIKSTQKFASLLEERDKVEAELETAKRTEEARRGDLQRAMSRAWRTVLSPTVRNARAAAQAEAKRESDSVLAKLRAAAAGAGHCEVCGQDVSGPALAALKTAVAAIVTPGSAGERGSAWSKLANLDQFEDSDNAGEIRQLWNQAEELKLRQASLRDRLSDLTSELADADTDAMRRSSTSYVDVIEKLTAVKGAIEAESKAAEEKDQNIQRIKKQLDAQGDPEQKTWQRRATVLRQAADVFSAAVERYKADLRKRVEDTATKLFLSMTTERTDYAGLAINEGYGLSIVHRDGKTEDSRSAGAEHVVALALMGALQRNAPLQGPIVMDSLFGRLDQGHTRNVITALPEMAEQVILLVHEHEVTRDQIRGILRGNLKKEYELQRVSARRTNIAAVK
jgi:DNA sulfur modification protein DndD